MLVRKEGNVHLWFGDDLTDMYRHMTANDRQWKNDSSVKGNRAYDWDMGANWEDTMRLARDGWSAGAVDFHAAGQALPVGERAISTGWDVAGEYPDVGRFTAGDPLHMHTCKRKPKTPVVHLVVNISASGGTKASAMRDFGAAICAIVDQLENSGRRVELDMLSANDRLRGNTALVGWKVKRADDPLDLGAVAFSLAHPVAYRRIVFGMWERTPLAWEPGIGYGAVSKLTRKHLELLGAPDAIMLDGVGTSYYEGARDMLRLAAERVNTAAGETLVELER